MEFACRHKLTYLILTWVILLLCGCASVTPTIDLPPNAEQRRIDNLNRDILALGNSIDPEEAQRAARISIQFPQQLAKQYQVSGSALMHNMMVNLGTKPRGLCIHWTEDLLTRLQREQFQSLDLHWAIANYDSAFRIEHSTVVVSADGESLYQGLVLDPWRNSGYLFWSPTLEDSTYPWKPRAEVHALKKIHALADENRRFSK